MSIYYSASTGGFYDEKVHGYIEIDGGSNPDTRIPSDAVLVDDQAYQLLIEGQSSGQVIRSDDDGNPLLEEAPPASKDHVKNLIDFAAGKARLRFVSSGELVEQEYRLALHKSVEWIASGMSGTPHESISDWAVVAGLTNEEAAQSIIDTSEQYEQLLTLIRRIRLEGKAAVDNAITDFDIVAKPFFDQLEAITP